ncbi:MAG: hypothetical protein ACOX6X_03730 [Dethiobacteria bacterium]|jgi:chromosome segregation protein
MASNRSIVLEKLVLEGFGPYQEKVEFHFTKGINCYVAENERGKTSMVAGLIATIFGLSHRQKTANNFTLDRFRNWENPPNCKGEVTFTNGQHRYRIARNFDTHRIKFWVMGKGKDSDKKKLLIEGQDNPEGRKILASYKEKLLELLGISSQELFNHTFCVEQPLPEPQNISTELQGLLSGGKGIPFENALETLREQLKSLTKYTGPNDRGVTSRNMAKDGQLEQINERIKKQTQLIKNGKQAADSLLGVREQLRSVEEELRKKVKELQQKEKARQALTDWRMLADRYRHTAQERDKLKRAEKQAQELENKIDKLRETLEGFSEFSNALPGTEDNLVKLSNIEQLIARKEESILKLEHSLQVDLDLLEAKFREKEKYIGWEHLGDDPVDKLKYIRRSAEICRKEWEQFQSLQSEVEKIAAELNTRFRPFEQATDQELGLAADYYPCHVKLNNAVEKTKQVCIVAEAELNNLRAAKSDFEAKFKDLIALGEGAATAINSKLEELKKWRELNEEKNILSARIATPLGFRFALAVILAGVAGFLIGTDSPLYFAAAVLGAAFIGFFATGFLHTLCNTAERKKLAAVQLELDKCRQGIAACSAKLGQYANANEVELGRLAQRFRQYAEDQEQLQTMAGSITEEAVQELLLQKNEAEAELLDFEQKMSIFTENFEDVTTALHEWQHLCAEKERLERQLETLAREALGSSAEQAAVADPLAVGVSENWQETARFIYLTGTPAEGPPFSVATLFEILNDLSPAWWQEQEQKAAHLAEIKKEIYTLDNKNSANKKYLISEKEKRKQLQLERDSIAEGMQDILQKNGDPVAALGRWRERQQLVREKGELEIQLKTILQNNNVQKVDELRNKVSAAYDQALVLVNRWQEHIEQNPELPTMDQADDMEGIRGYLEQLETAMEQLEKEKNKLERTRNELSRKLASLEGAGLPNIAVAELELAELIQEKESMELNADALTIAYKELENTINEYRQTHKERLEKQATIYCKAISGRSGREVKMDQDFMISVLEDGRPCTVEQLSKGARDQLYLALRFAVADLLAEEMKLPFIFDDPFTSTDAARLANIRKILREQAKERQFIIMAHAKSFLGWGKCIEITG